MAELAPAGRNADVLAMTPAKTGMIAFLFSEAAFFSTLVTTYLVFLPVTRASDPSPAEVFSLPLVLFSTACLLSSSVTIHFAELALRRRAGGRFLAFWGLTILLGSIFITCTGIEWVDLIGTWRLTISQNIFGTTYFTLVGFHAAHVTAGLVIMTIVFGLAWRRRITAHQAGTIEIIGWYWHFVDGVWVVVFSVVYLLGR